jgi:hypothetical protein
MRRLGHEITPLGRVLAMPLPTNVQVQQEVLPDTLYDRLRSFVVIVG